MKQWTVIGGLLLAAVVATGIGAAQARHHSRGLYNELQRLEADRDRLNVVWGQLQLEQAAWSDPGRVQRIAREWLGMAQPASEDIVLISP